MKKYLFLIILIFSISFFSCSSSKKSYSEKKGLMILENTQLGRNSYYTSKKNVKKLKTAHKKYNKNGRYR